MNNNVVNIESESNLTKVREIGYWLLIGALVLAQEQWQRWGIDPKSGQWKGYLQWPMLRLGLRECIVYFQLIVGYLFLKAKYPQALVLQRMFIVLTIGFDALFLIVAALRQFVVDFSALLRVYNQLYYSLGSGLLFVFFYGMGKLGFDKNSAHSDSVNT
jgi:hypothetical protein